MNTCDFHSPPASPLSSDHQYSVDGDASPHANETQSTAVRRRRKRIAIELPPGQTVQLNKVELKKLKNRIAAARARERTQKQVAELAATVEQLWRENQQQQVVISHLRGLLQVQQHQPDFNKGPATHGTHGSYQDMLTTETSFLLSPCEPQTPSCGDLHARLLAEFIEMFPTSGSPHVSYQQLQHHSA